MFICKSCFHILIKREKHKMHMQQLHPRCMARITALGVSVVGRKHEMYSNCPDSFNNFQNIEISKVVTFH